MANRLQLKRGSGAPGAIFYEGEPIYDKTGKVLYVGDTSGTGSGAGTSIASGVAYDTVLEMLTQAATGSAGAIKFQENGTNGNHFIGLTAPASVSSSTTFVLPDGDGSANQVLKTDGSGNLGFATVSSSFTLSDGSNTDTFSTGGTLTFSGTTNEVEVAVSNDQVTFGLPDDVTIGSDLTVTDNLYVKDNKFLTVGNDSDIIIYHSSLNSNSRIVNNTGDLYIETVYNGEDKFGDDIIINAHDDVEIRVAAGTTAIYATGGGSVKLNHNGSTKFETSATGATLTGTLAADGVNLGASEKLDINGGNLQIYADGSNNAYLDVSNSGSNNGDLYIRNNVKGDYGRDIYIQAKKDEHSIICTHDAAVELYYDNGKKLETTSSGASITGDLTITGNINVTGTAVTFSTEITTIEDRLLELGLVDGAAPTTATTWDLGVLFNYNNSGAKKSGIVWLDNQFIAAVGVATETIGVGNTRPQLNVTSYADLLAKDLYLGGTANTNLVINSNGQAQNLVFDGGSY